MTTTLQLRSGKKWLPIAISRLERHLSQLIVPVPDCDVDKTRALCKNIAYSIQHLQFIDRCGEDLEITSVIYTQNIKTFVIVGSSILEAAFWYLLVANGKAARTEWKSETKTSSAQFSMNGELHKIDTEIFRKLETPELESMTFDAMCKRVEKRELVKLKSEDFYQHLPYLRKLRNRVHIHGIEGLRDTDWITFNRKEIALVKKVLYAFLQSSLFPAKNEEYFSFLSANAA